MDSVNSYLVSGLYRVITDRLKKQKPISQAKGLVRTSFILWFFSFWCHSLARHTALKPRYRGFVPQFGATLVPNLVPVLWITYTNYP